MLLFKHKGKVPDDTTYDNRITAICSGIMATTNQAKIQYKLFRDMPQGNQPFSIRWSKVRDQAERCNFNNDTKVMADRDAILFNTTDTRLRKKVLAENTEFNDLIKLD